MKTFINVAQMKLASLKEGQFVETGGETVKGDGGQARYLVVAGVSPDDSVSPDLANGNYALYQGVGAVKDLSQAYIFDTVAEAQNSTIVFRLGKELLIGSTVFKLVTDDTGLLYSSGIFMLALNPFSVEIFGAKLNDETFDSTTAFNDAIEAARRSLGNRTVMATGDFYRIDGTIDMVSRSLRGLNRVQLIGHGSSKLKRFSSNPSSDTIVAIAGQSNWLYGFEIIGEIANQGTATGAYAASGVGLDVRGFPQTWLGDSTFGTKNCKIGVRITDVNHGIRFGDETNDSANPDTTFNDIEFLWITGCAIGYSMDGTNQLNNSIQNLVIVKCKVHADIINGELTFESGSLGSVGDREKGVIQPESTARIQLNLGRVVGHNFRVEDNNEIHAQLLEFSTGNTGRLVEFSENVQISSKDGDTDFPAITCAGGGGDNLILRGVTACNGYIALDNVNVSITNSFLRGTGPTVAGILETAAQQTNTVNKNYFYRHEADGNVNSMLHPTQEFRGYSKGQNKPLLSYYNGTDQSSEGARIFEVESFPDDNCRIKFGAGPFDIRSVTNGATQIGRIEGAVVMKQVSEPAADSNGPILFGNGGALKVKFSNGTVGTISTT